MRTAANPVGFAGTAEETHMQQDPQTHTRASVRASDILGLEMSPSAAHPSVHTAANPVGFAGPLTETKMQPAPPTGRNRPPPLPASSLKNCLKPHGNETTRQSDCPNTAANPVGFAGTLKEKAMQPA